MPKFVLLFGNDRTSDGGGAPGRLYMGFATIIDGAPQTISKRATGYASADARVGTQVAYNVNNSRIYRAFGSDGTSLYAFNITAALSNGFTIDVTAADAGSRIINYILIGGDELTNVTITEVTIPGSTGNQANTSLSYTPTGMITLVPAQSTDLTAGINPSHARWCVGFAGGVGAGDQGYAFFQDRNAETLAVCRRIQKTGKVFGLAATDSLTAEASVDVFASNGWTLNWTNVSASGSQFWVITLGGVRCQFADVTQPTSTGLQSIASGMAFTPKCALTLSNCNVASANIETSARMSFGAGLEGSEASVFTGASNNIGTTVTDQVLSRTKIVQLATEGTPTVDAEADLDLDAAAASLDWTTVDSTQRKVQVLLIGEASPKSAPPINPSRRARRILQTHF